MHHTRGRVAHSRLVRQVVPAIAEQGLQTAASEIGRAVAKQEELL